MKNLFIISFLILSQMSLADDTAKSRSATCLIQSYTNAGGKVEIYSSNEWGSMFSVEEYGINPYIDLAFTRMLQEIGLIALDDTVAALYYSPTKKHCELGVSSLNAECSENLGKITVVLRKIKETTKVTETTESFEVDSIQVNTSREGDNAYLRWQMVKNGKWAYTGVLPLYACTFGEHTEQK